VLSFLDRRSGPVGGLDQHLDVHQVALDAGPLRESGGPEDAEHPIVVSRGLRDEAGDAALPGGGRQVLEQDGADSPTLLLVADDERHLGRVVGALTVVTSDTHDPVAQLCHQRHPTLAVHVDGSLSPLGNRCLLGGEQLEEDRLV
jgi:hypothetical protein